MNVDTAQKRKERAEFTGKAKPQRGVGELKSKLSGAGAPAGVVGK
jgi:hypothetical protein